MPLTNEVSAKKLAETAEPDNSNFEAGLGRSNVAEGRPHSYYYLGWVSAEAPGSNEDTRWLKDFRHRNAQHLPEADSVLKDGRRFGRVGGHPPAHLQIYRGQVCFAHHSLILSLKS